MSAYTDRPPEQQRLVHLPEQELQRLKDENTALRAAVWELTAALEGVVRTADRATVEFDAARAAIKKGHHLRETLR